MDATQIAAPSEEIQEYLHKKKLEEAASHVIIPTLDAEVRRALLAFDEPESIENETNFTRRQRLKMTMANRYLENLPLKWEQEDGENETDEMIVEPTEVKGTPELASARKFIREYSLSRAQERLSRAQKAWSACSGPKRIKILEKEGTRRRKLNESTKSIELSGTQSGFARPVSSLNYHPSKEVIACGDWSGTVKLLSSTDLEVIQASDNLHVGKAVTTWSKAGSQLATSGEDGIVKLWSLGGDDIPSLTDVCQVSVHSQRVTSLDFHPTDKYLASASHDKMWGLLDVNTEQCILNQQGHCSGLTGIKFHPDGGLIVSVGLDGWGLVWDLRTGKIVMKLDGHAGQVHCVDTSVNGYQIATGSSDDRVIIWDMRQVSELASIPAHCNVVTDVKFCSGGDLLLTSGYDERVRLWSCDDWRLRRDLECGSRVLSADFKNMEVIAGRWDRSIDLFKCE